MRKPAFKDATQEIINFHASDTSGYPIPGLPAFDSTSVVDGQRILEILHPLPPTSTGRAFTMHKRVLGAWDKGDPGTVLHTEQSLVEDVSGVCYARIQIWSFFVNQGHWGGERGPAIHSFDPPSDAKPDASVAYQTSPETPLLYRLNGDYNPLHATPEPGSKMGFGGVINHGLIAWNMSALAVLTTFGGSQAKNLKLFQARFAAPVMPGDKLVVEMWRMGGLDEEGWEEVRFVARVEGGKVALKSGRALVRCVESRGEKRETGTIAAPKQCKL
ncbi:hypothetical protein BP5796_05080 [Coleophoma crateriformis]|uniref:MaoC-like domain-containing protein n=1 Tax=Coleophoma crateriformis TaxID=565419 RepID=A0A3D8S251_9HELO|nr:hypothetical protein BP5796_05080 [Coleophoma crateriformis]